MEIIIDKEWKKRVNSLKRVTPFTGTKVPNIRLLETFVYPEVYIVIYSDMGRRHIKGVFKNIDAAQDYKERLERATKKRSLYQKILRAMACRHETLFIETHIVRGYIV